MKFRLSIFIFAVPTHSVQENPANLIMFNPAFARYPTFKILFLVCGRNVTLIRLSCPRIHFRCMDSTAIIAQGHLLSPIRLSIERPCTWTILWEDTWHCSIVVRFEWTRFVKMAIELSSFRYNKYQYCIDIITEKQSTMKWTSHTLNILKNRQMHLVAYLSFHSSEGLMFHVFWVECGHGQYFSCVYGHFSCRLFWWRPKIVQQLFCTTTLLE